MNIPYISLKNGTCINSYKEFKENIENKLIEYDNSSLSINIVKKYTLYKYIPFKHDNACYEVFFNSYLKRNDDKNCFWSYRQNIDSSCHNSSKACVFVNKSFVCEDGYQPFKIFAGNKLLDYFKNKKQKVYKSVYNCRHNTQRHVSYNGRTKYETWPQRITHFLDGNGLRAHSNFVYFDYDNIEFSLDSINNRNKSIIYSRAGSNTDYFFKYIHPRIKTKYVLISGSTDSCSPSVFAKGFLESKNLIAYFGRNPTIVHPKFIPLPTGIESFSPVWIHSIPLSMKINKKYNLFVENFNMNRNENCIKDRKEAMFHSKNVSNKVYSKTKNINEWIYNVISSKFALAPVGNGLDCSRTWRMLLLGTVPIISSRTNPLTKTELYDHLPVLIVEDWSEMNDDFLNKNYVKIIKKMRSREYLFLESWVKYMNSFVL